MNQNIKIIYDTFSILAVILYVCSVQFKNKKGILITQIGASLSYLIVYLTIGAWSGAATEVLEEIKDFVFLRIEKKGKKIPIYVLLIFLLSLVFCAYKFYDGILSLLPPVINILLFTSTYYKNPKAIRYVMVLTGILWGIYNVYCGLYIICIGNILEVGSAILAIIRYKEIDDNFGKKKKINKGKKIK